ncbi:CRISPR-associated protein Cas5 [Nitrincola sp. A-D6]|uniref:type I-E CRISPR-associated protein Cas5/CasD n=1 Tax=Nitrincola sp. A-D6 TaxID=1545442 RepID=UPI00051FD2A7|nr:type I-E CRISPR-associated protein Cas5/CasD [Nitrincola sp. A-D6]KGK41711.1 CRISPR-associated protein Cas5 [Nitrincola sp. A-D6]
MQYLVFRLYGPMASWGEAAVGGDRPTAQYPGRAAILGLLAAAMGIKRDEQDQLSRLASSVQIAVKQYSAGVLMRDYHTAQVPSHDKKIQHRHRKSELSVHESKLNTVLSSRDYRCDGVWVVAISSALGHEMDLQSLSDSLEKPKFTLYLGRKSCPLAAPLMPQLIETDSLQNALDLEFPSLLNSPQDDQSWLHLARQQHYYWQGDKKQIHPPSKSVVRTLQRWDEPGNRMKWQFNSRDEHQITINKE